MQMARTLGAEILNVDSMQVYRGMDIGTAKPSAQEQREVPHHLLDVVEATENFTVAEFVRLADLVIADCQHRRVPLIACGGTPLYYKALFEGLFEGPGADAPLRDELRNWSSAQLHERLATVDAASAARLHVNDTRRVIRALEVHHLTGRPISQLQVQWESSSPRHSALWIGLNWVKEQLNRRINARVKTMLENGWVEEVRRLLQMETPLSLTAAAATGYAQLIAHLRGQCTLEEAAEQIKIATRQLARRQMKWFRRFAQVKWLNNGGDEPAAMELLRANSP